MTPTDLLGRLEAEGVSVSLNLKVTADKKPGDDTRARIRDNRDALLEYLARECVGAPNASQSPGLTLYGDLLHSLMVWVHRYHELRLEHPGGVIPDASPEQAAHHLTASTWAVLYDETKTILVTSGTVPARVLKDKTELQTTEPVQAQLNTVTAEKVVN